MECYPTLWDTADFVAFWGQIVHPTPFDDVNQLLAELEAGIRDALGETLVGLYLSGSLTYEGYTPGVSDLDLLAAVSRDLNEADLPALRQMHAELIARHPEWDDRIEVIYYSLRGLRTYKTARSPIAVISPGEPLHFREEMAGDDWLMNWYLVLEHGVRISGPPADDIIEPASIDEFIAAVRDHARDWALWIDGLDGSKSRAYAILTMCRTLYTDRNREHVSKQVAAEWTTQQLPAYAGLIKTALQTRVATHEGLRQLKPITLEETREFVATIRELLGIA